MGGNTRLVGVSGAIRSGRVLALGICLAVAAAGCSTSTSPSATPTSTRPGSQCGSAFVTGPSCPNTTSTTSTTKVTSTTTPSCSVNSTPPCTAAKALIEQELYAQIGKGADVWLAPQFGTGNAHVAMVEPAQGKITAITFSGSGPGTLRISSPPGTPPGTSMPCRDTTLGAAVATWNLPTKYGAPFAVTITAPVTVHWVIEISGVCTTPPGGTLPGTDIKGCVSMGGP